MKVVIYEKNKESWPRADKLANGYMGVHYIVLSSMLKFFYNTVKQKRNSTELKG